MTKLVPSVGWAGGTLYGNVKVQRSETTITRVGLSLLARNGMVTIDVGAKRMYVRPRAAKAADHQPNTAR